MTGKQGDAGEVAKEVEQDDNISTAGSGDSLQVGDMDEDWDNGEIITEEERQILLAMSSNYERKRAMNIRRRKRLEVESGLADAVGSMVSELSSSAAQKQTNPRKKRATKVVAPATEPQRSLRNKM